MIRQRHETPGVSRARSGTRGDGDQFSAAIRQAIVGKDGGVSVAALRKIASANGISLAKYPARGHGWQGRLRMVTGNILRSMIRRGEKVVIGDKVFKGNKN